MNPAEIAKLPPEIVEALVEQYRRGLRSSLPKWCAHILAPQGHEMARHHRLIVSQLEKVASGEVQRQMIFLPPGSAKSSYASVMFPPWFMATKKGLDVVAVSHTLNLAERFGRSARDMVAESGNMLGVALAGDNTAAGNWKLTNGSRYYAVGTGGALTGRRADLILIDDPVKEDETDNGRESTWDWYNSVLLTRLKPDARVVIIMTRWHEDDLAGRLLATSPEDWSVLKIPAICEDADDPLGREIGEALWSDGTYGYGAELERKRLNYERTGATRVWSALYQQRPRPESGGLFKVALMPVLDAQPAGMNLVRAWDLAATAKLGSRDPDWTVGLLLGRERGPSGSADGRFVVADVVRFRGPPEEVEKAILATASRDGRTVAICLPQDPGQAGKSQVAHLTNLLAGYRVISSPETGDKATRASPVAAQCNVGNLAMVRAPWNRAFTDELSDFPLGNHDDQVDPLSRAFGQVASPVPKRAHGLRFNILGR